jgi:hypothetical protein
MGDPIVTHGGVAVIIGFGIALIVAEYVDELRHASVTLTVYGVEEVGNIVKKLST